MKWKASLFGPFRLAGPEGRPFQTKSKRLKAMLAYLASQPSMRSDRQCLARALFDVDDVPSGPNLSVLLTRAQRSLAAHSDRTLLVATSSDVSLHEASLECDLRTFEDLADRARAEQDPLASGATWHRALETAARKPLGDLDHPMLGPIRERIGDGVLEALEGLASGPLAGRHSSVILERLQEFELQEPTSAPRAEQLMRIFAGLGMKEAVVQTFASYETRLDDECGEAVPSALSALFESLLSRMDQPAPDWGGAPDRPRLTVDRRESLDALVESLESPDCPSRLTSVTGQSGIGKSHLLRALFWRLHPRVATAFFDLEAQPIEVAERLLADRPCRVVLIDHLRENHRQRVGRLVRTHQDTRFVCACHCRLGLPGTSTMTLGPLEIGQASRPGPAVELLQYNLRLVHAAEEPSPGSAPDPLLFELASLCDGIPLALEIAGRLGGSIGVRATIGGLRRNVDALTSDRRGANRRSSLRDAIESSYENLGSEAQRLVALLAELGAKCHVDHLLDCAQAMPCDLEEGILSGLVVRPGRGSYVSVLRSTAAALQSASPPHPLAQQVATFGAASTGWFEQKSSEKPLDLGIADSLPLALQMMDRLVEAGQVGDAVALFASIRPWLGSTQLGASQLGGIERVLMDGPADDRAWPGAVLALSAAYFHAGEFALMKRVVARALQACPGGGFSGDVRCQLTMQEGLAERALGNFDGAIAGYRRALETVDATVGESTLVKCYYNLGTLLEARERLQEALEAQESASNHFSPETDPRVESLVNTCIGRLRYRLGEDLDSAGLILEATLAHARERQDLRAAAEILQNLGQIYWERGQFARSALAETAGSCLLLDFGYNDEFRRLTKSSFVTLCAGLFELGLDALARATRTMVDRLGPADLYAPDQVLLERLAARTYAHPPGLRLAVASEAEVRLHLLACLAQLEAHGAATGEHAEFLGLVREPAEARLAGVLG